MDGHLGISASEMRCLFLLVLAMAGEASRQAPQPAARRLTAPQLAAKHSHDLVASVSPQKSGTAEVARVRSLSLTSAAVLCLLCQSYTEGQDVAALSISAALGVVGSFIAGSQKTPSFLMRFHVLPMLQGYVAASALRGACRILYRSVLAPPGPNIARPNQRLASGRVVGGSRIPILMRLGAALEQAPPVALAGKAISSGRRLRAALRPPPSGSPGRATAASAPASVSASASASASSSSASASTSSSVTAAASSDTAAAAPTAAAPTAAAPTAAASAALATARSTERRRAAGRRSRNAIVPAASSATSSAGPLARRPKQKVLILISDTGGGHRASAQALAEVMEARHGDAIETAIVDVWTLYGPWPFGQQMVPYYRGLAKRPKVWWAHFRATSLKPAAYLMSQLMSAVAYRGFEACIREHTPDVVVSMHPLCQAVPIKVLRAMHKADLEAAAAAVHPGVRAVPRIPFVTVVTDLATPHPFWLHPRTDLCFVPSGSFERAAMDRGLAHSQLRQHGLPVRPSFAKLGRAPGQPDAALVRQLGLLPDRKTILVVGGGDGVGKLGAIVDAMAVRLAEHNEAGGEPAQMAVICGKNKALCQQLQAREWGPHLQVAVEGFTSRMNDYMAVASCIVTKAGPGTIAEACCCGLPIMLSGFLPGQVSGH